LTAPHALEREVELTGPARKAVQSKIFSSAVSTVIPSRSVALRMSPSSWRRREKEEGGRGGGQLVSSIARAERKIWRLTFWIRRTLVPDMLLLVELENKLEVEKWSLGRL